MSKSEERQTFVLIPGAWCGAWAWHPAARLLVARGHDAIALTLPGLSYGSSAQGLGLRDATDHIVGDVTRRELEDVTLVGHSWGGLPATAAAHALGDRVSRVVYYNAVVPAPGTSMADENAQYGEIIRQAINASPTGTVALDPDIAAHTLMPDEAPALSHAIGEMLVPQPGGYMVDPYEGPDPRALTPTATYVLGDSDISLARPGAEFAARADARVIDIPGSHMTLITRPEIVADALLVD